MRRRQPRYTYPRHRQRSLPNMMNMTRTSLLLAFAFLGLAACRKKPAEVAPAPVQVSNPPAAPDNSAERDRLERERLERERLERERLERERRMAEMRATMTAPIYFGFDRSDLTTEARTALEAKFAILSANPAMRIMIEGHTDDVGSDEYNLALGQRRAAAAKRFLCSVRWTPTGSRSRASARSVRPARMPPTTAADAIAGTSSGSSRASRWRRSADPRPERGAGRSRAHCAAVRDRPVAAGRSAGVDRGLSRHARDLVGASASAG